MTLKSIIARDELALSDKLCDCGTPDPLKWGHAKACRVPLFLAFEAGIHDGIGWAWEGDDLDAPDMDREQALEYFKQYEERQR